MTTDAYEFERAETKAALAHRLSCIAHNGVVNGKMRHDIGLRLMEAIDEAKPAPIDLEALAAEIVHKWSAPFTHQGCKDLKADILSALRKAAGETKENV